MGLHDRAWHGLSHLIFSDQDLLPMKIEQTLAQVSPANEIIFESYEDYGDALDYSKNQKNVGFVMMSDRHSKLPVVDIFRNFANAHEISSGFPVYGLLFYNEHESVEGYRVMHSESRILDYVHVDKLLDINEAHHLLIEIWQKYVERVEEFLIPPPLQRTYLSVCEMNGFLKADIQFCTRVSNLLSQDLNISWFDEQALKWIHVVDCLEREAPSCISANPKLQQICQTAKPPIYDETNPFETIKQKAPLSARTSATIKLLNSARRNGRLDEFLNEMGQYAKPGAPALVRHLRIKSDQILKIAYEVESNQHGCILEAV